jgi:conjugal transfer mating pair stabilization protein TraG
MTLTIHAIGDSAFLSAILNSIAMVFSTQDLRTAAGIGALVGILLQAFRGLLDTGPPTLRYAEFIGAILLWMALFQPTTPLAIEDAYTGEVRVVDHVPLGPAVSGAIISELGYGLTVLFETAFSVPTLTRHGYAGALETLTQVRRNLLSRLSLGKALDPTPTSDVASSVSQYVRDCTLTGVDLGVIEISTLLNTGGLPEAFRYDSEIYATEIRDGDTPLLVTCTAAWPRLRHLVEDQALPLLTRQLGLFMSAPAATDPMETIQSALDALTQGQQQASDFVLAAAMVPLF